MLTRLARWWLARKDRKPTLERFDECERCGGIATHRLVSLSDDDEALGISGGGTAMSADYCAEHCPGGCLQGCPSIAA